MPGAEAEAASSVKSRDREDGVKELLELDLFEISVVPHPMNADTRFIEGRDRRGGAH